MGDEDKRAAVGMSVTLSSQLIAAALAMLAVEAAYVSYALGARNVSQLFLPIGVICGALFTGSIFVAGKAITLARNAGFGGNWSLTEGKDLFNLQAVLLLAALAVFVAMLFFSGDAVRSNDQEQLRVLRNEMDLLKQQANAISSEQERKFRELQARFQSLETEFKRMIDSSTPTSRSARPAKR